MLSHVREEVLTVAPLVDKIFVDAAELIVNEVADTISSAMASLWNCRIHLFGDGIDFSLHRKAESTSYSGSSNPYAP